jgi:hypothetical protein
VPQSQTSPHVWEGIGPFWRRHCHHCYFPKEAHPIRHFWPVARPLGDKRRLTWLEAATLQTMGPK